MANEQRLIDLDKIKPTDFPSCEMDGLDVVRYLETLPTVDAVEVVHARWKYYHKQNIAVCTNCSFERNLDADFGKAVSCPNCGAKMDGGNGDG